MVSSETSDVSSSLLHDFRLYVTILSKNEIYTFSTVENSKIFFYIMETVFKLNPF